MVNIPNKSDGDILYAKDLFKVAYKASTIGNTSSGTETQIGSNITISANTLSAFALIFIKTKHASSGASASINTRVYSGVNATFGANTQRLVITTQTLDSGDTQNPTGFVVLTTEETWTSDVIIQITGQAEGGNGTVTVEEIAILGI